MAYAFALLQTASCSSCIVQVKTFFLQILELHVVPGVAAYSTSLINGEIVPTLEGSPLIITLANGSVEVSSGFGTPATVTTANIAACSAVVHIINQYASGHHAACMVLPFSHGLVAPLISVCTCIHTA
jgi:uncharacterized surface protein with fasciclin (FAS1) repeats